MISGWKMQSDGGVNEKTSFSVRLMCYIVIVSMAAVVISTLMNRSRVTGIMEENMQLTSEQTMYEAVSGFSGI